MDESIKRTLYSQYTLGDMTVSYYLGSETGQMELLLVPSGMEQDIREYKFSRGNSLVHCKLLGDDYSGSYAGGLTMMNSGSILQFSFRSQEVTRHEEHICIDTVLSDSRGYELVHHLKYRYGEYALNLSTTFQNHSQDSVTLEELSSFCLNEITPFQTGDGCGSLLLHRIRSKWSGEGRLQTETIEDLQLEPNWSKWQPHSERFGQVGSLPVKKYFPFLAAEDTSAGVIWGIQLGIESSWQMEAYRRDDALTLCGGIADREFGHWMKTIANGESFTTPWANVSVCRTANAFSSGDSLSSDSRTGVRNHSTTGVDLISQRLTWSINRFVEEGPESEQELPILFNEYCTTWGLPSHENIASIVEAIKDKGFSYFIIDCGWFVKEGKPWDRSMGDYIPSPRLFPKGLGATAQLIKDAGMKPGIWFEIDNLGVFADSYQDTEHLLKRDNYTLTTQNRRFWNMCDPWVEKHLTALVIGQLQKYGFEYMKMDYNDTIGIGCDHEDSLGEGLRANMEASVNFVRKVKKELPGIILENCASGGHKLEPLMMSLCSMASFSDAHECEEIPVIAMNLHRCILPRQSQIWAVIRESDSLKRIAYTMANTFLGRMCLSGDVTRLTAEQWQVIEDGIAFYKKIVPAVKCGFSYFHSGKGSSDRHLTGYQALLRVECEAASHNTDSGTIDGGLHNSAYAVIHTFYSPLPEIIRIPLPAGCPAEICDLYSDTDLSDRIRITGGCLVYEPQEEMKAVGIFLK